MLNYDTITCHLGVGIQKNLFTFLHYLLFFFLFSIDTFITLTSVISSICCDLAVEKFSCKLFFGYKNHSFFLNPDIVILPTLQRSLEYWWEM